MYAHKIDSPLFESSIIILEVVYKSYEIYHKNLQCLVTCNKNKVEDMGTWLINILLITSVNTSIFSCFKALFSLVFFFMEHPKSIP